jgi:hypothetical protein
LKVVLLLDLQQGCTKFYSFLCECPSRAKSSHYKKRDWPYLQSRRRRRLPSGRLSNVVRRGCTQPSQRPKDKIGGAVRRAGESGTRLEPLCPWGRVIKTTTPPSPKPTSGPVTQSSTRTEVTTTRTESKTVKSAPKVMVGPKQAPVTESNKPSKPGQPWQPKSKELVAPTQRTQSHIEEISDLLDNLPLNACVELTCRLLTSVPTLPYGPSLSRAVLKIVVLFIAEYGSTA